MLEQESFTSPRANKTLPLESRTLWDKFLLELK